MEGEIVNELFFCCCISSDIAIVIYTYVNTDHGNQWAMVLKRKYLKSIIQVERPCAANGQSDTFDPFIEMHPTEIREEATAS